MKTRAGEMRQDAGGLRARLVGLGLGLVFAIVAAKGAFIALEPQPERTGIISVFEEEPLRADIVDRNNELLATSITVYSLFADPRVIWDASETVDALAVVFPDIDKPIITARLSNRDKAFVWIERGLTPRQRQAVFELGLEGLGFRKESRRAYPRGTLAGHTLGYTKRDGEGAAGLEFALDHQLAAGGEPLRLTLDSGVQYALEEELSAAASVYEAINAVGVVMEVSTGEIRAIASWPPLDPNRAHTLDREDPVRVNRAVSAVYELGSVFKPLTAAAGLETGVISLTERLYVADPLTIHGATISDQHPISASANLTEIIAHSSNIGIGQVALRVGVRREKEFLASLGLFDRAPIEIAGSAAPLLPPAWTDLALVTVSYGHGIAVSPVAFTSAFSALGNGGEILTPTLVMDEGRKLEPRRVMSAPTAAAVTAMLRETVTRGTGTRAEVAGYRVAGKTGTAEKPVDGGYDDTRNVTSFAALFPANGPEYVVLIVLDEPKAGEGRGRTASWNAAPTAGRVIERIAPMLGIVPEFDAGRRDPSAERRSTL
ncbi:MAG: penicillin-binding protein 2 [Hyphomonadaceae bacterium]